LPVGATSLCMVKSMPDQSSASTEHALIQEITGPLATLPDDPLPAVADVEFPTALRGYDRLAVDAYVRKTSQLVAELQATRSPDAAIRRALERVGEEVSGILQRAHETAERITSQSRSEAEDRLEAARQEAAQIVTSAEERVRELDAETDRIWAERHRIVEDTRDLAQELLGLTDTAANSFPAEAVPVETTDAAEGVGVIRAETEEVDPEDVFAEGEEPFLGEDESFSEEEDESFFEEEDEEPLADDEPVFADREQEPGSDVEPTAVLPIVEPHAAEDDDKPR
jgi:cell division septum initiation protein DivIVA